MRITTSGKENVSVPIQLLLGGRIKHEKPSAVIYEDRLRVGIFETNEHCDECDEPIRWLQIEFLADGEWKDVLGLDERNFPTLMSVMNQVQMHLDR